MADTCFFGSSTVTKRSRVSPSRSSSSCRRFRREDEEAGLDVSTALPLGRLKSYNGAKMDDNYDTVKTDMTYYQYWEASV